MRTRKLKPVTDLPFGPLPKSVWTAVDFLRLREVLYRDPHGAVRIFEEGVTDESEGDEIRQNTLTPASVLFPIVLRAHQPTVLLTQRAAHLKDHPGQISFPGGRAEPEDSSPAQTALREAEEEVGLLGKHIEIVGYLPQYLTSTGFCVTPVVAFVTPPFELRPDPFEVAEIFEVPLAFLLDPANHRRHSLHHEGKLRQTYAMPYGDYFIWGATAGIIVSLHHILNNKL